ncbi:MAG: DUF5703 domain-containing protein [Cellulosilyticaceae bacterium]
MKNIYQMISKCDVVYHTLGETDRSAMPIGNGELAASVWVDQLGDICFYLSRTDAISELDRTIKLGMFKISLEPRQFSAECFKQTLKIGDGTISLEGADGAVMIWIDRVEACVCIEGDFRQEVRAKTQFINWRTEERGLHGFSAHETRVKETADHVINEAGEVLFYHQNGQNTINELARLQGMEDYVDQIPDFLTHRIFGGMTKTRQHEMGFELCIMTLSEQTTEEAFTTVLRERLNHFVLMQESKLRTQTAWRTYWEKSYIFIKGDPELNNRYNEDLEPFIKEPTEYTCECESSITKAYIFTKYMNACCNEGTFPVLYNGLLFNLCPGGNQHLSIENFGKVFTSQPESYNLQVNPDERSWCREHLWQNIRHPYCSLLARGEGEKLKVLLRYYRNFWGLNRARAKVYYHAQGQHNTEMTLSCGLQTAGIYGMDRTDKAPGYAENRWGGAVDISPGLELVSLMLDYYDFMKDTDFLETEVLPYFKELLQYIETRFPKIEDRKMSIGPINAVETYRDTINPIPIIAGLRSTLERVLAIGKVKGSPDDYFKAYYEKVPTLPMGMHEERPILLPATGYEEERFNVEIPELYACFPFKNFTFYKPDQELAAYTYLVRTKQYALRKCFSIGEMPSTPSYSGWQYMGVVAALLGLKEEAKEILMHNCTLQNPGTRFPGMWGPIYDAVPDTDHGANILNQLQHMVMQVSGDHIYILPAFPKEWDVAFKLYADQETVVEVSYQQGKIEELKVVPESRLKDIRLG